MLTITNTNQTFEPKQTLTNLVNTNSTGCLKIHADNLTWEIYLQNGKLKYAQYSLQNLQSIKHILLRYNFVSTVKLIKHFKGDLSAHKSIFTIVDELLNAKLIINKQKSLIYRELTNETIELYLWLENASYEWKPEILDDDDNDIDDVSVETSIGDIAPLVETMELNLQTWQKFYPVITSPFQRIICPNLKLLQKNVPNGDLSPTILKQLFHLIQGGTIRQIAIALKKSDLKTAQLLLPYIKHKIVGVKSPNAPFDRLPSIPHPLTSFESNSEEMKLPNSAIQSQLRPLTALAEESPSVEVDNSNNATKILPQSKLVVGNSNNDRNRNKTFKIVSIDDSPTMLDMIKNYLGDEKKYDVSTLENPMLSLGVLFSAKPDLILMDFSMPGINGYKLCSILRKSHVFQKTPIIMVSGNLNLVDDNKWQTSGITDYLPKPFDREDLIKMIERHL